MQIVPADLLRRCALQQIPAERVRDLDRVIWWPLRSYLGRVSRKVRCDMSIALNVRCSYILSQNAAIASGKLSGIPINLKVLGVGDGLTVRKFMLALSLLS